jgi:hypothetical protein
MEVTPDAAAVCGENKCGKIRNGTSGRHGRSESMTVNWPASATLADQGQSQFLTDMESLNVETGTPPHTR